MRLAVPIEGLDEAAIVSAPGWREVSAATRHGGAAAAAAPVSFRDFLGEDHHRAYGRPWLMGRLYHDVLVARGLRPEDRLLDIGCGAGRVGIWTIPFLLPGHYHGFDAHLASLLAFAAYEVPLHGLARCRPRLRLLADFAVGAFGARFDVAVDFYVTRHLGPAWADVCYRALRACMDPGGRLLLCHAPALDEGGMAAAGFRLAARWQEAYRLPVDDPGFGRVDDWHEYRAA